VVIFGHDGGQAPLQTFEEIAANEAGLADPRSYVLSIDGVVAILLNDYDRTTDLEAVGLAVLRRASSTSSVTLGVGRSYPGIDGIRRTFREARWAATVGEMLWGPNRVVTFRELGIYGLLEPFIADPASSDTQDVEKLLEYDRANQAALLPTVEAYFDAGRSGDVAAGLFVHRNTIAYRLRVVRRVTGLDVVRDPDARLLLEVQIRLARLWGLLPAAPAHRVAARGGAPARNGEVTTDATV
jgi:sugar diacid utilization regulator